MRCKLIIYNILTTVIILTIVTGCGGGAQAPAPTVEVFTPPPVLNDTAASSTEATATTAPAQDTAAAASAEGEFVLNGVTLQFPRSEALIMDQGNFAMVESFNDWIPNGEDWSAGYVQIANEALWYVNYVTGEVIPWMAESMEYSDDYKTWTLHIKPGITWNDGTPFTVNDIVYTLELLKSEPKLSSNPDILAFDSVSGKM